jgi:hypothetical protein
VLPRPEVGIRDGISRIRNCRRVRCLIPHRLVITPAQELSEDGWQVTSARFKGNASDAGPLSIEFSHPLSTGFGYGLGRQPNPFSSVREGLKDMLASERAFTVIRQAPRPAAHPELLKMLRVVAFVYQWPPATLVQVAEAVVGGRALDVEEGAWLVFAVTLHVLSFALAGTSGPRRAIQSPG